MNASCVTLCLCLRSKLSNWRYGLLIFVYCRSAITKAVFIKISSSDVREAEEFAFAQPSKSREMLHDSQIIVFIIKKKPLIKTSRISTSTQNLLSCYEIFGFTYPLLLKRYCFSLFFENVSLIYTFQKSNFRIASLTFRIVAMFENFQTQSAFQIRS